MGRQYKFPAQLWTVKRDFIKIVRPKAANHSLLRLVGCYGGFLPLFMRHGNADLGHKLFRIIGHAIVDERNLAGKAGDLHIVLTDIFEQLLIRLLSLRMTSPKTQPRAERFRQFKRFRVVNILLIQ